MKPFKLVIFDFDGTLGDSLSWFGESINIAAKKFNFRVITEEEKQSLREQDTRKIMAYLGIPWWKVPFIATFMRQLMKKNLSQVKPFPRIDTLIHSLSDQGHTLAIVSSNSLHNVTSILGPELTGKFSIIECGSSVFGKAAKFKKVLRKAGVKKEDVLSVGDEVRDIEAAKALGIKSAAVTWGYAKKNALDNARADYLFDSVDDLITMLSHH